VVDAQLRVGRMESSVSELIGIYRRTGHGSDARSSNCCDGATRGGNLDRAPEVQVESGWRTCVPATTYTSNGYARNGQVYSNPRINTMDGRRFRHDLHRYHRSSSATSRRYSRRSKGWRSESAHRTRELSASLEAQRLAKQEAEAAKHEQKTRFSLLPATTSAAALNHAARLFVSALRVARGRAPEFQELASRHR